ncbi:MAG: host attachment protein, partial [Hyphococcus sp.]
PPAPLGVIRKRLPPEVTATLIGAFDKDLTNLPEHALKEYFIAKLERW